MKNLYVLVGLPGTGKSTWIKSQFAKDEIGRFIDTFIIDTDSFIEHEAEKQGKTYNEVFKAEIKNATKRMWEKVETAKELSSIKNIVWDQTNLTKQKRQKILQAFPPDQFFRVAVYFGIPEDHAERLLSRPGKMIPDHIIETMKKDCELPALEEGFSMTVKAA